MVSKLRRSFLLNCFWLIVVQYYLWSTRFLTYEKSSGVGRDAEIPSPIEIPVHKESSYVASDVSKIIHVPAKSRIEVHLQPKSTRRCQNPVFRGRISGWSLSMIEFETKNSNDVVVGTYDISQMPMSGKYFVEIIVLLCEGYGEAFMETNLQTKCMESTIKSNHRITDGNGTASIEIVMDRASSHPKISSGTGRWLHKAFFDQRKILQSNNYPHSHSSGFNQNTDATLPPRPLFTRYQPNECMIEKDDFDYERSIDTAFCNATIDPQSFDNYDYYWNQGPDGNVLGEPILGVSSASDSQGNVTKKVRLKPQKNKKVCFVGSSHSRELFKSCMGVMGHTRSEAKKQTPLPYIPHFKCLHTKVEHSHEVNETWVLKNLNPCTHAIVGLFQWDFSNIHVKDTPTWTFSDWKEEMTKVARILDKAARGDEIPLTKVFFRSAHTNGLKWHVSQCPPEDMRSPHNAHLATSIVREIVDDLSFDHPNETPVVSVVDTEFLIDPIWDSAKDWSHYGERGKPEVKYMLSEILKDEQLNPV